MSWRWQPLPRLQRDFVHGGAPTRSSTGRQWRLTAAGLAAAILCLSSLDSREHSEDDLTNKIQWEAIKWSEDMAPGRFTNELEVAVSPAMIWSLLVDPKAWPSFYPGVEHVQLSLSLGTLFETDLAGQDVLASVEEFEPMTRIAWYRGPKASEHSKAYHAWIITPTSKGCHLWTEETMKGPLWIELAKKAPDAFWLTHEKLLANLAKVAT